VIVRSFKQSLEILERRRQSRVFGSRIATLGTASVCALIVAACGTSSTTNTTPATTSTPTTTSTPASSSTSGETVPVDTGKATGSPYVVGDIDDSQPGQSLFGEHLAGVNAAIDYINNQLGGVNGHPLKLYVCNTGTEAETASTATCADKVAAQNPIMVVGTATVYGLAGEPIMTAHQIPSEVIPELPQDFANPDNFPTGGGSTSEYQAEGAYAEQAFHPKTVTILTLSEATSASAVVQTQKGLGSSVNAKTVLYPVTGGTTLPSVVQAVESKPDVLILDAAAGPLAVQLYKEIQQQGYPSDHIVTIMAAADGPTLKEAGTAIDGAVFTFEFKPWTDTSDPQVGTYLKEMAHYPTAGVTDQSGWTEWGFSDVMQLWAAASKVSGTVTGPKLLSYLKSAKSVPGFLNQGIGAQSPGYPGIRNPYVLLSKDVNGKLVPLTGKWFGPPLLLPTP
jgi:branched-chain amino acid transport system substrate-binding protein